MSIKEFILKEIDGEMCAIPNPVFEKEKAQKSYDLFLKKSGIPSFYWNIDFKDYQGNKESKQFKSVEYYAQNLKNPLLAHAHLYLHGLNSSQKTALAINVLKEGIRQKLKVHFTLAGTLIAKLMKVQGFKEDVEISNYLEMLKTCDVICIDDAFDPDKSLMWKKSDNKNMIVSEWDTFLRELISSNTKIILTSNFNLEIIDQYYSKSIHELVERNFAVLEFTESVKAHRKSMVTDIFKHIK